MMKKLVKYKKMWKEATAENETKQKELRALAVDRDKEKEKLHDMSQTLVRLKSERVGLKSSKEVLESKCSKLEGMSNEM